MRVAKVTILLAGLIVCCVSSAVQGELSREETYSLFSAANEAFGQATSAPDDAAARQLYDKAILSYERIISEAQIQNSKLYYNLGNTYFLNGELGKAILNYRRAEKLDESDADIRKNLAFARSKRIDKVVSPTERRVLETLFFWHYDFSVKTRFVITCVCFGLLCLGLTVMVWFGSVPGVRVVVVVVGIGLVCFLASVLVDAKTEAGTLCGVITAAEVVAHQADWEDSPASFKEPLHAGTEFELIEERPGWLHIRLLDESDGWILRGSAELI